MDWFDVGEIAFKDGVRDDGCLPPLNDMEAQRGWLGGFGAAWAEGVDVGKSVEEAFAQVCEGRGRGAVKCRSRATGSPRGPVAGRQERAVWSQSAVGSSCVAALVWNGWRQMSRCDASRSPPLSGV
jgi:hypothetical protein